MALPSLKSIEGNRTTDQLLRMYATALFACVVIQSLLFKIPFTGTSDTDLLKIALTILVTGLGAYWLVTKKSPIIAWLFLMYAFRGIGGSAGAGIIGLFITTGLYVITATVTARLVGLTMGINKNVKGKSLFKKPTKSSEAFLFWAGVIASTISIAIILIFSWRVFDYNILLISTAFGLSPFIVGLASKIQLDIYPAIMVTIPFAIYCLFIIGVAYLIFGPPQLHNIDGPVIVFWFFINGAATLGSLYSLVWRPIIRAIIQ